MSLEPDQSIGQLRHDLIEIGRDLVQAVMTGAPHGLVGRLANEYTQGYEAMQARQRSGNLPAPQNPLLTAREAKVITLAVAGHDAKGIAALMKISPLTVKVHLRNARAKTGGKR